MVRSSVRAFALILLARSAAAVGFVRETARLDRLGAPGGLEALIDRPRAARGRLPAVILLGGLETGARSLDLVSPDAPVVLATFEYPYDGPRRFRFPRTLLDIPKIRRAVAETPADLSALHRYLRRQPYIDPDRLCVLGASFGAPYAIRAAAEDSALRCLIVVHGFADLKAAAAHRLEQLWTGRLGGFARPASRLVASFAIAMLRPPAPELDAPRLRRDQRVLAIEAADDTIIPGPLRQRLWDAIASSPARSRRAVMPGEHLLGAKSDKAIREIMEVVERWLPIR